MTVMKSNASALIVTASRPLTGEQVDQVRAEIARQLPAGTAVVVIPSGFTAHSLALAPTSVELRHDQADLLYQQVAALGALQEIGLRITDAIEAMGNASMRVAP
ncbi:hypothetical protein IFT64_12070 [Oxalobacteraceae sp. CFBP 8753]|nr:hypothetical protein [Oxalobacteraceae sp. CFBP 8753]